MISDGMNKYDENVFYLRIMNLTEPKFEEIISGEESFLENDKLKIIPGIDKIQQKKDIEQTKLCCTCPFCNKQVEAEIGGGTISCPNCKKSAPYSKLN